MCVYFEAGVGMDGRRRAPPSGAGSERHPENRLDENNQKLRGLCAGSVPKSNNSTVDYSSIRYTTPLRQLPIFIYRRRCRILLSNTTAELEAKTPHAFLTTRCWCGSAALTAKAPSLLVSAALAVQRYLVVESNRCLPGARRCACLHLFQAEKDQLARQLEETMELEDASLKRIILKFKARYLWLVVTAVAL